MKFIFGISILILLISIIMGIRILIIVSSGEVTPFGYGYSTGILILFTIGLLGTILSGRKIFREN